MPGYIKCRLQVFIRIILKRRKKGRTKEEVDTIILWLTGYDRRALQFHIDNKTDFETFFAQVPQISPNVSMITGMICGYRVEDPLIQRAVTWISWLMNWQKAGAWIRS